VLIVQGPRGEQTGARGGESREQGRGGPQSEHPTHGERGQGEHKGLSPEQVQIALTQTWTGFNAQVGRDYSTLTLNIPKKPDGTLELSFVDAIPQMKKS